MRYKKIPLLPTEIELHLFVGAKNKKRLKKELDKVFGGGDYFSGYDTGLTYVQNFKKDGCIYIICSIKEMSPEIAAHEALHVLYHLSYITGVELMPDSQEWQAIMIEYIVNKMIKQ